MMAIKNLCSSVMYMGNGNLNDSFQIVIVKVTCLEPGFTTFFRTARAIFGLEQI